MANDEDDPRAKEPGDDGVHRLRDILVEEVSMVDRAANKRKFLIVKRSNDVAKNKQRNDAKAQKAKKTPKRAKAKPWEPSAAGEDGDARKARRRATTRPSDADNGDKADADPSEENDDETEKADDDEDEDDDETEAEKADDEEDDDETEAEKADGEDDEDEDNETEKAGDEDDEDEEANKADEEKDDDATEGNARPRPRPKRKATKADDPDDEDDEDDEVDEVVLPAAVKTAVLRALTQAIDRLMAIADRVKEADSPDDETEASVPEDLAEELDDIGELLEGIGERLPSSKAVAKGGARMAKDRLHRFEQAIKLLSDVLKELTEGKQPTEPSAGSAAGTRKRDAQGDVATLAASVQDLLHILKDQQGQLDRVRKAHGLSNAIPIEGGTRTRRAPADVSWPLDMNRPISRDSVGKAVSFYDDNE